MRGQDRAAEGGRIRHFRQVQRAADRVGMDLQPERRFGGAARHDDPLGRECGAEILHDEFCAEADAFDDRAIGAPACA